MQSNIFILDLSSKNHRSSRLFCLTMKTPAVAPLTTYDYDDKGWVPPTNVIVAETSDQNLVNINDKTVPVTKSRSNISVRLHHSNKNNVYD